MSKFQCRDHPLTTRKIQFRQLFLTKLPWFRNLVYNPPRPLHKQLKTCLHNLRTQKFIQREPKHPSAKPLASPPHQYQSFRAVAVLRPLIITAISLQFYLHIRIPIHNLLRTTLKPALQLYNPRRQSPRNRVN